MNTIAISHTDLIVAGSLVLALGLLGLSMGLNLTGKLYIAATRTVVQLVLLGLVLKFVFSRSSPGWIALLGFFMLVAAAREIQARQAYRLRGWWGVGIGGFSMLLSSFSMTLFALVAVIEHERWYEPRYAIPLLSILFGNTMTGVSLVMNSFNERINRDRLVIEQRLTLGETPWQALRETRLAVVRDGMIPMINSMSAAGLVSIPGVMTGQILAGHPPQEAMKYQILIMFLIAAGTGLGVITAVSLMARRVFDERSRLRLDRVEKKTG